MERITLTDQRILAYREYGPRTGYPVLYFHGTPSTSLEAEMFGLPAIATDLGLRLIVPDRPGLGGSDFQRGRRITHWPNDVLSLIGLLGIERLSIVGYSGGSAYALVCGRSLPEIIDSITLISGCCPFDVPGVTETIDPTSLRFMRMAAERPGISRLTIWMMAQMARNFPGRMIASARSSLPEPDGRLMENNRLSRRFVRLVSDAARQGVRGPRLDTALMVQPWGFDPANVPTPVTIWHGEEDRNAPIAMAHYLADRLSAVTTQIFPGEGHLSLFAHRAREILESVPVSMSPDSPEVERIPAG